MLTTLIVGASGYVGAEVVNYLYRHPNVNLHSLAISAQSQDKGKLFSDLHPHYRGIIDLPLMPLNDIASVAKQVDVVFLATDHKISHELVAIFVEAGCIVFDLSGAYRVIHPEFYEHYYGFEHKFPQLLKKAVYGLAEWQVNSIKQANLIAVPGCYPTVSQLALRPLVENDLLDKQQWPIINAVSGVSGAGRKASLTTSFCEVSLQPYSLFTHRHQPEIAYHLGIPVIFTPHLGNFTRGILATITCRLKSGVNEQTVYAAFSQAYGNKPLIRFYDNGIPSINGVVGQPFCDIGFSIQNEHIIIIAAEDNLLKGAAAQAVQCFNLRFGFKETEALF